MKRRKKKAAKRAPVKRRAVKRRAPVRRTLPFSFMGGAPAPRVNFMGGGKMNGGAPRTNLMSNKKRPFATGGVGPINFMGARPKQKRYKLKNTKYNSGPLRGLNIVDVKSSKVFNLSPSRAVPMTSFIPQAPVSSRRKENINQPFLSKWGDADMDGTVNFLDCEPRDPSQDGFMDVMKSLKNKLTGGSSGGGESTSGFEAEAKPNNYPDSEPVKEEVLEEEDKSSVMDKFKVSRPVLYSRLAANKVWDATADSNPDSKIESTSAIRNKMSGFRATEVLNKGDKKARLAIRGKRNVIEDTERERYIQTEEKRELEDEKIGEEERLLRQQNKLDKADILYKGQVGAVGEKIDTLVGEVQGDITKSTEAVSKIETDKKKNKRALADRRKEMKEQQKNISNLTRPTGKKAKDGSIISRKYTQKEQATKRRELSEEFARYNTEISKKNLTLDDRKASVLKKKEGLKTKVKGLNEDRQTRVSLLGAAHEKGIKPIQSKMAETKALFGEINMKIGEKKTSIGKMDTSLKNWDDDIREQKQNRNAARVESVKSLELKKLIEAEDLRQKKISAKSDRKNKRRTYLKNKYGVKMNPMTGEYTKSSQESQRRLSRGIMNVISTIVPGQVAGARAAYGTGRRQSTGPKRPVGRPRGSGAVRTNRPVGRPKGSFKHNIPGKGMVSGEEYDEWEKIQRMKGQVGTINGPKPVYRTSNRPMNTNIDMEPEVMTSDVMEAKPIESDNQAVTQPMVEARRDAVKERQRYEQRNDNVLNVVPLHSPDIMKGEMVGTSPVDSILNAPNINEGGMRNVQGENTESIQMGDRPQTNPHGDEYLEIEPGSGKAYIKQRVNEKWATGEAI